MSISPLSPETAFTTMQAAQSKTPQSVLENFKNAPQAKNAERIKETAREFEAVFMAEMIKPMFEGLEVEAPFGGGKGEEIFRGMLLTEFGKEIATRDVTGIQTQVMNKMIELQAERTANQQAPVATNAKQAIIDLDVIE